MELRDERSASEEVVKRNTEVELELAAFNSNRKGYIKRQEYNALEQKHEKLKEDYQQNFKLLEAWKS